MAQYDMLQKIAAKKGYRYYFSRFFVTCTLYKNEHLLLWAVFTLEDEQIV